MMRSWREEGEMWGTDVILEERWRRDVLVGLAKGWEGRKGVAKEWVEAKRRTERRIIVLVDVVDDVAVGEKRIGMD